MPKRFKFRFEPMLKVKKHKEQEKQKVLAQITKEVMGQQDRLTGLDNQRESTLDYQRKKIAGTISLAETLLASRYLLRLKREKLAGEELLQGLKRVEEERRQDLLKAARERKIYEMLKEKQQLKHRKEMDKLEQKELDEVATNTFRRKKNS